MGDGEELSLSQCRFNFATKPRHLPAPSLSLQIQNIILRNQEFGLSLDEPSRPFYYLDFDGILGLAYPGVAISGFPTLLQNLLEQHQLSKPLFSFYFSR